MAAETVSDDRRLFSPESGSVDDGLEFIVIKGTRGGGGVERIKIIIIRIHGEWKRRRRGGVCKIKTCAA